MGLLGFTVQFLAPLEIQRRLINFIASEYVAHAVKDTMVNCTSVGLPASIDNSTLCPMSTLHPDLDDSEGWYLALILGGAILFVSLMNGQIKIYLNKIAVSLRAILMCEIYRKTTFLVSKLAISQ